MIDGPPGFGKTAVLAALTATDDWIRIPVASIEDVDQAGLFFACARQLKTNNRSEQPLSDLVESSTTLVLIGRSLGRLSQQFTATRLDSTDLAFTAQEAMSRAEAAGLSTSDAEKIVTFTRGWPEYTDVVIDARRSDTANSIDTSLRTGPSVAGLVDRCTRDLSPAHHETFGQLAHLDRFSQGLVAALGLADGIHEAETLGLPLIAKSAGWVQIAEPVRSALTSEYELQTKTAEKLASTLAAEVGLIGAASMLVSTGQPTIASDLLRNTPVSVLEESDLDESVSLLRLLTDLVKDDGELHVRLGRLQHWQGSLEKATNAFRTAKSLAADQLRPEVGLEADVELLLMQLPELGLTVAAARHEELVAQAAVHATPATRVRLREIDALLTADLGDLSAVYRSASMFDAVAREWTLLGEPGRAASTLRVMTATTLTNLGRFNEGRIAMESACALVEDRPRSLARSTELLARMYAMSAEVEKFNELAPRTRRGLKDTGEDWRKAYDAWSHMVAASFSARRSDVSYFHRVALSLLGDLLHHPTAAVFFAESAVSLALVDDPLALEVLKEATSRMAKSPLDVGLAEVSVHARVGDPTLVPGLANHVRAVHEVSLERDWRITLDLLIASTRVEGQQPGVTDQLREIREEAGRWQLSMLADALITGFQRNNLEASVEITLLGRFAVEVNGSSVELPPGHVSELIKLLAMRSRPMPVDMVVDQLWPDAALDVGKRRLKNVITRARASLGADALTRSSETIELDQSVRIDVREFRRAVREAPRDRRSLDLYSGTLLPSDVYSDWVDSERSALADEALLTAMQIMRTSEPDGPWMVNALRRIDPPTEQPWIDVAEYALERGDLACARECARIATGKIAELGVAACSRLITLQEQVRVASGYVRP